MNKKSKIISAITAAAVATSALAWSAFADEPVVYETKPGALLGAATHFHLFAEEVTLESHVHGNVATNMLNADRDFGVRPNKLNGLSSINYIKDFSTNLNEQTLSTMLVLGNDITVEESDNGNKVTITSPSGGTGTFRHEDIGPVVNEDKDTPYIDIKEELKKLATLSETIAAQDDSTGISQSHTPFGWNLPQVNVSSNADGFLYYTLDVSSDWDYGYFQNADLYVNGLDFEEGDFLYLTIEVGNRTDVTFPKSWKVSYGESSGTDWWGNPYYENYYSTGEEPLGSEGRIIYNIVSNGKPYEGKITLGESKSGTILAPKADIEITGNTNGTIIGRTITCHGESHRWDVQVEGTYDASDNNPDLTPEEEEVVTTTTTAATTTPAPETTTTTTEATTTTPEATTTTAKPTTTTEATTTSATTTTEITTTTTVIGGGEGDYEGPTSTSATNVGGNDEEVTTTTATNVGGNDEEVTTTTANVGGNDEEVTTTTATTTATTTTAKPTTTTQATTTSATTTTVIGGGEGDYEGPTSTSATTTTANVGGNDEEVTTTTANVGGNDEEVTTTTATNVGGNDEEVTTTTATNVGGNDEEVTTTTATNVGGNDEEVTTTTATNVGGNDEEVTTTTATNVGGNDEEVTTTTATNVGGNDEEVTTTTTANNGTGSNDEEAAPELPSFDEIKEMIDKLPEEITDDETAEEYDKLMSTITEMIEKGDLTSSQTEELEALRKVLGDKYTNYVSSTNDNAPNTGFKAGVTIAISAGVILILAALAGRKKLEE